MKNIRIDYYSSTGGSEWVAKLLADKLKLIYDTKKITTCTRFDWGVKRRISIQLLLFLLIVIVNKRQSGCMFTKGFV